MPFRELVSLFPCHSLEDFPIRHEGAEADSLLAAWVGLWRPELVAAAGQAPTWQRVDFPDEDLSNCLIAISSISMNSLPEGFVARAESQGALLIKSPLRREDIFTPALARLENSTRASDDFAADFAALGYTYLQVQLMTRQLRYTSNLDDARFRELAIASAKAAMAGDQETANAKLHQAFDLLSEERNQSYSADLHLLDLLLLAPSTLGPALQKEISERDGLTLMSPASNFELLARQNPEAIELLKQRIQSGEISIAGGEISEERLPLFDHEAIRAWTALGAAEYERLLGARPTVFARRRYGLTPALPQTLHKAGYKNALHFTLDDGKFPTAPQSKFPWEGLGGVSINVVSKTPLDAGEPGAFLGLGVKLGETLDGDQIAVMPFARWPGQACSWFEDVRRAVKWTAAFGKFAAVDQFFKDTGNPGYGDSLTIDGYVSPYLKQSVDRGEADPISSHALFEAKHATFMAATQLAHLASCLDGREPAANNGSLKQILTSEQQTGALPSAESLDSQLKSSATRLSALITKKDAKGEGRLILNPLPFTRRVQVSASGIQNLPAPERPIYAVDANPEKPGIVIDVPPMGFAWITRDGKRGARRDPVLIEDNSLRNEFVEALISPKTGTLLSLLETGTRANRFSQQLALRSPSNTPIETDAHHARKEEPIYSRMIGESLEVTEATPLVGEITTKGRLVDAEGMDVAKFMQRYRLTRGSRVVEVNITLDPLVELSKDPWNHNFCARFAWNQEAADISRGVHGTRQITRSKRFESPHYLEVGDITTKSTIFTGGLAFHQRYGTRMLDTLLIVKGETQREFRLGMGLDVVYPMHEATHFLSPLCVAPDWTPPPSGATSGWLFHVDARNVLLTSLEPIFEGKTCAGVRIRLLESLGRAAETAITGFREFKSAHRFDDSSGEWNPCEIKDGKIQVQLAPGQWTEVTGSW
jgi:alpha-mannosidase